MSNAIQKKKNFNTHCPFYTIIPLHNLCLFTRKMFDFVISWILIIKKKKLKTTQKNYLYFDDSILNFNRLNSNKLTHRKPPLRSYLIFALISLTTFTLASSWHALGQRFRFEFAFSCGSITITDT